ncbi:TetR family transcriptional regulator [Microbispora rosea subsp. aerata]|nr:TetR family transcriptional regulator [Microbispora rosea subsp. aerata]GIH57534.1 TetR family transcriptional regulator [Microbispora rosea subsp. aerata]GLJ85504.1 TetR family transcriptional regulator [Microbispora rosea subsp. aerata]
MGLRERKKQRTRDALIDAALDLFLAKGYEATTIDQIAARVEVSPRTFFRYFASKEDVALSLTADEQKMLLAELTARPESEPPFTALSQAMRSLLGILREADEATASRYRRCQQVVHSTPTLLAGMMRLLKENERRLVAEVARRLKASPCDLLPQFIVSVFVSVILACVDEHAQDPAALARRLDDLLTLAERSLRPGWDMPVRSGAADPAPATG